MTPPLPAADVAARLSARDKEVLGTLSRLRIASANQLYRLCFPGVAPLARQRALARLSRWGLIRRLDRKIVGQPTGGSSPFIYSLDVLGQQFCEVAGPRGGKRQRPWTPGSAYLRHAVLVSEVYVVASEIDRDDSSWRLQQFQNEPDCWRECVGLPSRQLKPDAYLVMRSDKYEDSYFIEVDCATESPSAIQRKLSAYVTYWRSGSEQADQRVFPKVLFLVPDDYRREQLRGIVQQLPEGRRLFQVELMSQLRMVLTADESLSKAHD